jgi:choline dehydrogenase
MSLNMKVEHMYKFHQFEVPTAIKHGIGSIRNIGKEVKNLGVLKYY